MIQTVLGTKGSGKTKRLIDMANDALKVEHGHILYIDDDKRYMYDLRHEIRLVNISEFDIKGPDMLYGLLCGMLAVNYDITLILLDPFIHLMRDDLDKIEPFIKKIEALSEAHHCRFVIAVSGDPEAQPECLKRYAV
ncbi:MAG: hypothetical protein GX558_03845 [Clostridiales bacterium]|nr:hypothetical protein [Clostridiales bacterium]